MTTGERGFFRYNKDADSFEAIDKPKPIVVEAPFVVTDEMSALQNYADGNYYTSKARFREATRRPREEAPYGYIERGDEPIRTEYAKPPEPDIDDIRDDTAKALNLIRYGMAPASEMDKEIWKREQRQLELEKQRSK